MVHRTVPRCHVRCFGRRHHGCDAESALEGGVAESGSVRLDPARGLVAAWAGPVHAGEIARRWETAHVGAGLVEGASPTSVLIPITLRSVLESGTASDAWRAPPSVPGHVARRSAPPASPCPRPRDVEGIRGQRDPSALDQLLQPWSSWPRSQVVAESGSESGPAAGGSAQAHDRADPDRERPAAPTGWSPRHGSCGRAAS